MPEHEVSIDRIDHVELVVPDPPEAAEWYREVFGFEVLDEYDWWERGVGPLVMSAGAENKLALFQGSPKTSDMRTNFRLVAFGVSGDDFLTLVDRLAERSDVDVSGRGDIIDHSLSFSVYFSDPYEHRFEVTTEDYEYVANAIT